MWSFRWKQKSTHWSHVVRSYSYSTQARSANQRGLGILLFTASKYAMYFFISDILFFIASFSRSSRPMVLHDSTNRMSGSLFTAGSLSSVKYRSAMFILGEYNPDVRNSFTLQIVHKRTEFRKLTSTANFFSRDSNILARSGGTVCALAQVCFSLVNSSDSICWYRRLLSIGRCGNFCIGRFEPLAVKSLVAEEVPRLGLKFEWSGCGEFVSSVPDLAGAPLCLVVSSEPGLRSDIPKGKKSLRESCLSPPVNPCSAAYAWKAFLVSLGIEEPLWTRLYSLIISSFGGDESFSTDIIGRSWFIGEGPGVGYVILLSVLFGVKQSSERCGVENLEVVVLSLDGRICTAFNDWGERSVVSLNWLSSAG